jgi:hypothetical protein
MSEGSERVLVNMVRTSSGNTPDMTYSIHLNFVQVSLYGNELLALCT